MACRSYVIVNSNFSSGYSGPAGRTRQSCRFNCFAVFVPAEVSFIVLRLAASNSTGDRYIRKYTPIKKFELQQRCTICVVRFDSFCILIRLCNLLMDRNCFFFCHGFMMIYIPDRHLSPPTILPWQCRGSCRCVPCFHFLIELHSSPQCGESCREYEAVGWRELRINYIRKLLFRIINCTKQQYENKNLSFWCY